MLDELFARLMLKVDCSPMALSAEIVIEIRFYIVSPRDIVGLGAWVKLSMSRGSASRRGGVARRLPGACGKEIYSWSPGCAVAEVFGLSACMIAGLCGIQLVAWLYIY